MGLEGTPGIVLGSEGLGRSGGSEGMVGKLSRRRADETASVPSSERAMTMSEIIKNLEQDMVVSN